MPENLLPCPFRESHFHVRVRKHVFHVHPKNLVSMFVSERMFPHFSLESENMFLCLCQKGCFHVSVKKFASMPALESMCSCPCQSLFTCPCRKAYFCVCVGKPVSVSMSESMFCLCRKACFHVYVKKSVSMSVLVSILRSKKHVSMSVSKSQFQCPCRKTYFCARGRKLVFVPVFGTMFPCLCRKACFRVYVKNLFPCSCHKACVWNTGTKSHTKH